MRNMEKSQKSQKSKNNKVLQKKTENCWMLKIPLPSEECCVSGDMTSRHFTTLAEQREDSCSTDVRRSPKRSASRSWLSASSLQKEWRNERHDSRKSVSKYFRCVYVHYIWMYIHRERERSKSCDKQWNILAFGLLKIYVESIYITRSARRRACSVFVSSILPASCSCSCFIWLFISAIWA